MKDGIPTRSKKAVPTGPQDNQVKPRLNEEFYLACNGKWDERAKSLLAQGADINFRHGSDGMTPLHNAAGSDNAKLVKWLLENGADATAKTANIEQMEKWLREGANINACSRAHNTALHYSAWDPDGEVTRILLRYNADVNAIGHNGVTPLHSAAQMGNDKAGIELVKHGAKLDIADHTGATPLMKAAATGSLAIIKLLVSNGANLNLLDQSGANALHYAARSENKGTILYLLRMGLDPCQTNNIGQTPMDAAKALGSATGMVEALKEFQSSLSNNHANKTKRQVKYARNYKYRRNNRYVRASHLAP